VECDGVLAATATAVCYERRLAWIGMLLTDPAHRGRGFARRLMEHAIDALTARRMEWIKLDATEIGAPLYRQLRFEPAFGADRSVLLNMLAPLGAASLANVADGYAMARPGSHAAYCGPCVSRRAEGAGQLLGWFLARHPGQPVCWIYCRPTLKLYGWRALADLRRSAGWCAWCGEVCPVPRRWSMTIRGCSVSRALNTDKNGTTDAHRCARKRENIGERRRPAAHPGAYLCASVSICGFVVPSMRKLFYWKLKAREIKLGERTAILGVLNVTPDSFSDGGKYLDPDRAFARALEMEEQGADIIDIGAESTRPESARISAAEELRRLIPVLKRLRGQLTIPISVDTYKTEVAERAIEHGAEIINDPTGLTFEAQLARVVSNHDAGLILNHMRGRPETWAKLPPLPDVMGSIVRDLEATVSRARHTGIDRSRIVVDPGLGFGKRKEQNSAVLTRLHELASLDLPILTGPSRKSFLAHATDRETLFATAAAATAAILGGAHLLRVHDVLEMRAVADVADEILRQAPGQ